MAVDRSPGAADRSDAVRSEAPGDPLSVPDYAADADADRDALNDPISGRSGAIRLDESSIPLSVTNPGDSSGVEAHSDPPSAADVGRLRAAARLEISAHREAAAAHLRAETEWDAARDPRVWEPPRKRYAEATSRVWVTRHRALVALARLAAADPAECERFCATVNLRMTARDDGNGWVTDLASQDRSHRTLTGVLVLSLWTEPAEGDDGAS